MTTFSDVKAQVRAILGDPDKDWVTEEYLGPIVNHCYELICLYLSDTCSPYITRVVTIPNLPIGTTDLSKWQNDRDQPLYGLIDVFRDSLDWKMAGQPECYYRPVTQIDKLPNYTLSSPTITNCMYFEWRAFQLYVTPMPFAIDLRVRGEFKPPVLQAEDDRITLHPLLGAPLAEESASCASRERANPGQMQAYELQGTQALDNIANQLIRSQQGTTVRLGRLTRWGSRNGCGYGNGSGWGL